MAVPIDSDERGACVERHLGDRALPIEAAARRAIRGCRVDRAAGRVGQRDARWRVPCRSAGIDRAAEVQATAGDGDARQRRNRIDVVHQHGFDGGCIGGAAREQQRGRAGHVRSRHRGPVQESIGAAGERGQHLNARRSEMNRVGAVVREAGERVLIVDRCHRDDVRRRIARRVRGNGVVVTRRCFRPPPRTASRSGSLD